MTEAELVPPTVPKGKVAGLSFRGLIEVFYKPTEFFRSLVDDPKILVPYIIYSGLIFLFMYFTQDLVWDMVSATSKFQERIQGTGITPERMKVYFGYQYVVAGTVVMLFGPPLIALLGLFWGNFVFAGKARFKQILSVVLYGEVIYAVGAIVNLGLILPRGNLMANLSLGVLAAGQGMESWAYAILSKIALFLIWEIVAVGIGLSVLYNVKRGMGYRLSILSIGLISVLGLVLGKLFS